MKPFVCQTFSSRVVFGAGSLGHLVREIDTLGVTRALILSTPEQRVSAERVADLLGARSAGIFAKAVMHVPIETAREARDAARELGADCAVAIGGGSTTGLGKAVALESGLPTVAIPTTYAGSEMTSIYGITEAGFKRAGRDPRVLPRTVIYDPELSRSLPIDLSMTSGLNAIAHAAEGLYAHDGNPITALMAEEGIRAMSSALRTLRKDPYDLDARGDALYGAWLCGSVLGAVSMGLHHKLCHTLGGTFDLPHAEVHAVMLPHALAYNANLAPEAMLRIGRALGADDATIGLQELATTLGTPTSLRQIGMLESSLERAAIVAVSEPYPNPRPLEYGPVRALLQRAFEGDVPAMEP